MILFAFRMWKPFMVGKGSYTLVLPSCLFCHCRKINYWIMLEIKTILQITDECLFFLSKYDEWLLLNEKININGGLRYLLFSCYNGKKRHTIYFFLKENYGLKLYICTCAVTTQFQSHIKACTFLLLLKNKTMYISIYEGN